MNDRELLEMAAKAYSDSNITFDGFSFVRFIGRDETLGCNVMTKWNPLADDGDALRLAVKLGLEIMVTPVGAIAKTHHRPGEVIPEWADSPENCDHCAATRRAIVRAAAEIGKAMP